MGWYEGKGAPKLGGGGGPTHFKWDTGAFAVPGTYEEIISTEKLVYPKLKHWYTGEFTGALAPLNWQIKTMDRPKIDVEYVEQMRNNVLRNYPVHYGFGDVSITFWDDVEHLTISTLYNYFHGNVWQHGDDKSATGTLLLRDSTIIDKITINEHNIDESFDHTFELHKAQLVSIDYDSVDDDGDESVFTVQAVFKIEGFVGW